MLRRIRWCWDGHPGRCRRRAACRPKCTLWTVGPNVRPRTSAGKEETFQGNKSIKSVDWVDGIVEYTIIWLRMQSGLQQLVPPFMEQGPSADGWLNCFLPFSTLPSPAFRCYSNRNGWTWGWPSSPCCLNCCARPPSKTDERDWRAANYPATGQIKISCYSCSNRRGNLLSVQWKKRKESAGGEK